jgi:hypothetical protein
MVVRVELDAVSLFPFLKESEQKTEGGRKIFLDVGCNHPFNAGAKLEGLDLIVKMGQHHCGFSTTLV